MWYATRALVLEQSELILKAAGHSIQLHDSTYADALESKDTEETVRLPR